MDSGRRRLGSPIVPLAEKPEQLAELERLQMELGCREVLHGQCLDVGYRLLTRPRQFLASPLVA